MGDLTNTNQNDNSKVIDSFNNPDNFDTYKTMSANISKFGTVSTMFKVGGKFAPVFTGAQVIFEMIAEGPVKGFFTGAASVGGGAFGMGWGAVEGAKETWSTFRRTNNPINLINPLPTIMNMWKYSNKYSDIANIRTSIGCDLIGNSFKNLFQRNNSQGKLTGQAEGLTQALSDEVLNPDLSSNLKKGITNGQSASITNQGEEIAKNITDPKLSADDYYNHPEVNYDVTQRVLGQNGTVASPTNIEGQAAETDLAAASDPAGLNNVFQTPNGQIVQKVLYSGVQLGAGMLQGYLVGRIDQLIFGKEGAKKVAKVREGISYYKTAASNCGTGI